MRTRKISVLTMTAVALSLALTACNNDGADNASPSGSSAGSSAAATAESTPKTDASTESAKPAGTPAKPDTKCTDQVDYAGDSRSNAEINSIGEDTGTCPPVKQK
ncbi:hypothetical protein [Streptomyces longisporoflavus]|uniref:Secreted protein n=1 Tax=Streptomyces longisporoflavus TaxID=28044 RepID=A0ABW7QL88_9ACTN